MHTSYVGKDAHVHASEVRPSTKAKAIRLVRDHAGDYPSEYAAITAVSRRLGMTPETLRKWIRRAEVDAGETPGVTTEASREMRELRRKVAELERTIEILTAASAFFAREHDPLRRLICAFIDEHRDRFGVVPICRALSAHGCRSPRGRTGRGGPGRCRGGR